MNGKICLRSHLGLMVGASVAMAANTPATPAAPTGKNFTDFGPEHHLSWSNYRGDRIGIYNFNTKQDAGHVDVDFMSYDCTSVHSANPISSP